MARWCQMHIEFDTYIKARYVNKVDELNDMQIPSGQETMELMR